MERPVPHRLLIAALFLAAACGGDAGRDGEAAGRATLVACLQQVPQTLNPFVSPEQEALDLAPLLFVPLVRYGAGQDDRFEPALARNWEWDTDGRAVRFTLRDDLRWHDGEPVTAADVAWTVEAAADPAFAYWNAADFTTLADVEVEPEGAVRVRFEEPYGPGLEPFAILPILPRHLLADMAADTFQRAAYHREPVGNGPFVLRGRSTRNELVYERNPDYPAALGGPAASARLLVKEISELPTLLVELRTGVTDLCLTGPSAAREAVDVPGLMVQASPRGSTHVLLLDHRSPYFGRPEARRAVSAAIDRRSIAAVLSPLATPARTFMPASWTPGDAPLVPDALPALADSLLGTAGWSPRPRGSGRADSSGNPFEFALVAPQGFEPVLTVLQDQLARVGLQARTRVLEGSTFLDMILDPEQRPPAMVIGLSPSRLYYPDPRSSLHSLGSTNLGSYRNPEADAIIEALAHAAASPTRDSLYRALQARVATDVPLVHLLHVPDVVITGPRVEGVAVGPAGVFASAHRWRRPAD